MSGILILWQPEALHKLNMNYSKKSFAAPSTPPVFLSDLRGYGNLSTTLQRTAEIESNQRNDTQISVFRQLLSQLN